MNTPTLSFPTLSFAGETRTVVAPSHSDSLVTFTEHEQHGIDYSRLTEERTCDLLIYPTISDGSEYLIVLDEYESVTLAPIIDEYGTEHRGLSITARIQPNLGKPETWTTTGYVRVTRKTRSQVR